MTVVRLQPRPTDLFFEQPRARPRRRAARRPSRSPAPSRIPLSSTVPAGLTSRPRRPPRTSGGRPGPRRRPGRSSRPVRAVAAEQVVALGLTGCVELSDRPIDLLGAGDHHNKFAPHAGPKGVHGEEVAGVGDGDHRDIHPPSDRDGVVAAGDRLGKERRRTGGKGRLGQVDESKPVLFRGDLGLFSVVGHPSPRSGPGRPLHSLRCCRTIVSLRLQHRPQAVLRRTPKPGNRQVQDYPASGPSGRAFFAGAPWSPHPALESAPMESATTRHGR